MEEDDPGIPIRTAEMKDPETPPIQIASSRIKEVSVESPNVTGRRSASGAQSRNRTEYNSEAYHAEDHQKIKRLQAEQ